MLRLLICIVGLVCVNGFFRNDPCDITPWSELPKANETLTIAVHTGCMNGTFDWNYPQGTIVLTFADARTVCLKESLGGNIFTVTDITTGQWLPLDQINRGSDVRVCTELHNQGPIKLQFEAPEIMYYMGAVAYEVMT